VNPYPPGGQKLVAARFAIIINPANPATVETECFSEVFREGGNGSADIADLVCSS